MYAVSHHEKIASINRMTDKTCYNDDDYLKALHLIEKGFSKEDPIKLATRIHKSKENPDVYKDVDSDSPHWII